MAIVFVETRHEGSRTDYYLVEERGDKVLGTFPTQAEAIEWAKANGDTPFIARVRHLNDWGTLDHWRSVVGEDVGESSTTQLARALTTTIRGSFQGSPPDVGDELILVFGQQRVKAWMEGSAIPDMRELDHIIDVFRSTDVPSGRIEVIKYLYGRSQNPMRFVVKKGEKEYNLFLTEVFQLKRRFPDATFIETAEGMVVTGPERSLRGVKATLWQRNGEAEPLLYPPPPPKPGPAATLSPTNAGFDIAEPDQGQGPDAIQRALHTRLVRRVVQLEGSLFRIENSHGELVAEFRDYAALLQKDVDHLEFASVWSSGAALIQFIEALAPGGLGGTMTDPIEPALLAQLKALMLDHVALVEGSEVGRAMRERVARYREADKPLAELASVSQPVLEALLGVPNLLATRARHLMSSLLRGVHVASVATLPVAATSLETGRNAVLSIGMTVYRAATHIELVTVTAGLFGLDTTLLEPAKIFFRDHAPSIMALAANEPQMILFIEWVLAEIERTARLSNRV